VIGQDVTIDPQMWQIWLNINEHTLERSPTNAIGLVVRLLLLMDHILEDIRRNTRIK
jgi:hypothetical protein